ncbi:MAG: hypothetical protein A2Z20_12790 [Bdellovibrionales bacterium RBG_16_40_8]|nr:MAG: hypothetical protein A2Z20_12790 [Bdellovibrionales bacterium RBG_16_40_8]
MNEPNLNTRTGLFVVIGVTLLLLSILFFGGERVFLSSFQQYKVKFRSIQGLAAGSLVSLSGVDVGSVKQINFDDNFDLVATLNVETRYAKLINDKSVASIRTQGALGDKYIYILTGPSSSEQLKAGDFIKIDTQPDLLDIISGKAADLSVIVTTIQELNSLLHNLNGDGKSALLMESLVNAGQNISRLTNEPGIRESFIHLRNVLKKIDSGHGTLGRLVNDTTLHERLVDLLGDVPRNRYLKPLLREAIKENEKSR